jgi:hypothetical protein
VKRWGESDECLAPHDNFRWRKDARFLPQRRKAVIWNRRHWATQQSTAAQCIERWRGTGFHAGLRRDGASVCFLRIDVFRPCAER